MNFLFIGTFVLLSPSALGSCEGEWLQGQGPIQADLYQTFPLSGKNLCLEKCCSDQVQCSLASYNSQEKHCYLFTCLQSCNLSLTSSFVETFVLHSESTKNDNTTSKPRKGVSENDEDTLRSSLLTTLSSKLLEPKSTASTSSLISQSSITTPTSDTTRYFELPRTRTHSSHSTISSTQKLSPTTTTISLPHSEEELTNSSLISWVEFVNKTELEGLPTLNFIETKQTEEPRVPASFHLVISLIFGLLVLFGVMAAIGKQVYESWMRRHYHRMDFLIDGMYE